MMLCCWMYWAAQYFGGDMQFDDDRVCQGLER